MKFSSSKFKTVYSSCRFWYLSEGARTFIIHEHHDYHDIGDHILHDFLDYHDGNRGHGYHDSHGHGYHDDYHEDYHDDGYGSHKGADVVIYDYSHGFSHPGLGGFVGGVYFPSSQNPLLLNPLTHHDFEVVTHKKVIYPKKQKPKKRKGYGRGRRQGQGHRYGHGHGPSHYKESNEGLAKRRSYLGHINDYTGGSGNIVPGLHLP